MATNDFQPFAYGGAANVVSQSAYLALTTILQNGFSSGVAQSAQLNKVWRQSSIMAAVLAQFSSDYSGQNSTDDGTTATLETNLIAAIRGATKTGVLLTDTGSANAYTASNVPALTSGQLVNGLVQQVVIAHANTGASTYTPDGLTAYPIYGLGLQALQGGELYAGGTAVLMRATIAGINSGNPIWLLMECAGGAQQIAPATASQHAVQLGQINSQQSISAAVASNALTVGFNTPATLWFRNATLGNGTPTSVTLTSNLSLTIPSSATLGSVSAVQGTYALLVLYNGGTPALGIVNIAGGTDLSETGLISTTAISASATSASTVYSTSAITNSPYRVVGIVQATEATAGTWATAPSLVQGIGGQAFATLQSFGVGQTIQSMTGSRATSTTYYNTTNRPIMVYVTAGNASVANTQLNAVVAGVQIMTGPGAVAAGDSTCIQFAVPTGASYQVGYSSGSATVSAWVEMR